MGLEAATYIGQLVATNPVGATDPKAQGDDHLRLIKSTLQASLPNLGNAAMVRTAAELNAVGASGVTGMAVQSVDVGIAAPSPGIATTVLRTDAGLRLSQAISPTWTGTHKFAGNNPTFITSGVGVGLEAGLPSITMGYAGGGTDSKAVDFYYDGSALNLRFLNDALNIPSPALVIAHKVAAAGVLSMSFGNTGDNPTYNFLGSGAVTFNAKNNLFGAAVASIADGQIFINATGPAIRYYAQGAAADYGNWTMRATSAGVMRFAAINDLTTVEHPYFDVTRVGAAISVLSFGNATDNPTYAFQGSGAVAAADFATATGSVRDVPKRAGTFAKGECCSIAAGITLNTSDMAAGRCFSIYNDSAANITVTQGAGVTLRLSGTTSTGNRTLLARGMCTIWCNSGTEAIVSGSVT